MHLVDATLFFAPHSGGVKRYLLCKRRYLQRIRSVRHTLLVPGPSSTSGASDLVHVRAPRLPFSGGYRIPLRPVRWRDALCRLRPDLIEVGDPYHLAWAALGAAQRLDVPVVAFAHSHLSRLLASRFGKPAGALSDAYLRRLYARFDLVLAPSRSVATHLRAIGVERVAVQPLGVDTGIFHPTARDPELRSLLGLDADARVLVFAGRMAREKCIPLMRRAVEGLGAPYHLVLVGAARHSRPSACVTELPYQQDPRRLARLLASADALLHAGKLETFGLVILEAMACARPVIGIDTGAVSELIDDRVGRLAQPDSVESLQHAIRSLYEDDLERMGAQARERVERRYTWERTLGAQLLLYSRLARVRGIQSPLLDDLLADPVSS